MNYKKMNWALALALPLVCMSVQAATISYLGSAQNFGVLAGSTITNTGTTTIRGDIGVSPGTAIADNGTLVLNGIQHLNDGVTQQAQIDALLAYTLLASQPFTTNLSVCPPFRKSTLMVPSLTITMPSALMSYSVPRIPATPRGVLTW